jgi:L-asparaginase
VFGKKIVVLGTGGTIAGVASEPLGGQGYQAAQISVQALLQAVPGLSGMGWDVLAEQVAQIDSKDMEGAVWQRLLARCQYWLARDDVQGLVITHGTDTLEESAFFLHSVLAPSKPVVLTCAMRPATAEDADGPQNLQDALTLAAHAGAQGVLAVCAGKIHGARDVQKIHPTRIDPFSSGDAGPLGQIQSGQVQQQAPWPKPQNAWTHSAIEKLIHRASAWPRVEIIMSHAGASGALVDALLAPAVTQLLGAAPVKGLVVAATGNGSVHELLEKALLQAQAGGVRVQRASRCCFGSVVSLGSPVLADSKGLSAVKARVALMLELL